MCLREVSYTVALVIAVLGSKPVLAVTLWTENAENGTTNVIDNTDASYPLIQSTVVGQGNKAFHLAHPAHLSNSFTIDRTLTVQADTKLFFLSRLGFATSDEVARVQISTNGGSTWPTTIYNQAGSNGAGEGAFSLKTLNLANYVNQNVRFRFYYDFPGGNYYPQTTPGYGWYVDDIQIGSSYTKSQWSIGNPTSYEQQYLEYINRARVDALAEANRLAHETDPIILSEYSSSGVTTTNIINQFTASVANGYLDRVAQPLSFSAALLSSAELHSVDMYQHQLQQHDSSSSPPAPFQPGYSALQRAQAFGYTGTSISENVYSHAKSVAEGHAAFDVDWGTMATPGDPNYNPAFAGQGMQNPAGHRHSIHSAASKEIGIGVTLGTNGSVGPQVVTEDFGTSAVTYITGVVYQDNGNNFYDIGEGRSGVQIDVDGSAYYAISSASGGYSVPVPGNGVYNVTFSGGGFATFSTTATILNGLNVKIDDRVTETTLAGDFNSDGRVNAADYVAWRKNPNRTQAEYNSWRSNFGRTSGTGAGFDSVVQASVPEPGALSFLIVAAIAVIGTGRIRA